MDVDPAASLRCWAIDVKLAGRVFEIPALPAADWWPVLISGDSSKVIDIMVSSDAEILDELLLSGELSGADTASALTDAVEEAAGRPFLAACVLAAVAAGSWAVINGKMARRGFQWDRQPIGAALDALFVTMAEGMTDEGRDEFTAILDNPSSDRKIDRAKVAEDFEALAGPRPTDGVRATGAPSEGLRPRTRQRPRPLRRGGRSSVPKPPPAPPA